MKERRKIVGSLLAMSGAMLAGQQVVEVKVRDHGAVTNIWKEDKSIGTSLKKASGSTAPIVVEGEDGLILSVKAPDIQTLRIDLQNVSERIDKTGRAEALREDVDEVITLVDLGPTISDGRGRLVDGFQPIRDGINSVAKEFSKEENNMNRRKWWDRLLIAVGGVTLVGAVPAEALFIRKQLKKDKPTSKTAPADGTVNAVQHTTTDTASQKKRRGPISLFNDFTNPEKWSSRKTAQGEAKQPAGERKDK